MVLPGVAKSAAFGCAVTVPPPNETADQLRAIVPAHAQPFVPPALEALCGRKEAGAPSGPAAACAG